MSAEHMRAAIAEWVACEDARADVDLDDRAAMLAFAERLNAAVAALRAIADEQAVSA